MALSGKFDKVEKATHHKEPEVRRQASFKTNQKQNTEHTPLNAQLRRRCSRIFYMISKN